MDIDVHHGNGTEAIIRNLEPSVMNFEIPELHSSIPAQSYKPWLNENDNKNVLFISIHGYGGSPDTFAFYPGSGSQDGINLFMN